MQVNIILGNSIDSLVRFRRLENEVEGIVMILDYDLKEGTNRVDNVLYVSPKYAKRIINKESSVKYYKSLYIYPGMYKEMN
ncbi:hypothetical protein M1Q06_15100 [Planococcus sp. 11815]|uniref:hypothetical protein n=1 Tax=Planococcus sp. 11815 TaxID=2939413 RepID=UPI003DA67A9C